MVRELIYRLGNEKGIEVTLQKPILCHAAQNYL